MKNQGKTKIAFQTLRNGNRYTLIWLINGNKHSRSFICKDNDEANDKLKRMQEVIKNHYGD